MTRPFVHDSGTRTSKTVADGSAGQMARHWGIPSETELRRPSQDSTSARLADGLPPRQAATTDRDRAEMPLSRAQPDVTLQRHRGSNALIRALMQC